ncbi:hypothetical protein D5R40_25185 [Okeania hirsuta]|uniref:Uncharacterized protein n=1 Tax=Okeania hirsuta TaxID=1458930 RepID=A0A3N6PLD8_9CYAN|nr:MULTISPECIES: hypothetical protein [Okeania]NET80156.1 hypothetical protein [Okeania sp. SIO1F9]RQH28882.1 hypothetical protein D5R40_25185 [Okeania hirsuta]
MEKRGKNRQGLLIKAETTPQANHSVLHSEYFNTYDSLEALSPEQLRLLLAEKEKYTKKLEAWVDKAVNRSGGVNIENYSNKGDTNMPESIGDKIDIRENYGIGKDGEIREIRGAVGNKGEIYGLADSQGEIKDSKIARNIYEAQQKTLAETAAEIQQLLKQLEQSNPTETTAGQMAVVTQAIEIVENNPTLKQRVIGALKSVGTEAFKEALDNPVANILVAAFQGWIEP